MKHPSDSKHNLADFSVSICEVPDLWFVSTDGATWIGVFGTADIATKRSGTGEGSDQHSSAARLMAEL
jgi:hypothetical protein